MMHQSSEHGQGRNWTMKKSAAQLADKQSDEQISEMHNEPSREQSKAQGNEQVCVYNEEEWCIHIMSESRAKVTLVNCAWKGQQYALLGI